jgi:hypothetical protein
MGDDVLVPSPATLPQGVSAVPRLMVSNGGTVRFTFDEQRTKTFIREHGGDHQIPAGYDGATLIVTVPAASLQEYSTRQGLPALMVGQSSTVTATVDGELSLEALRGFLLGLPGLPPQVVNQLEGFDDWRSTLPIPIPLDEVNATDTTVDGADAVLVSEPGLGTGLVWQRDGRITGVAGTVDEGQLRRIAAGLQTAP